VPHTPPEAAPIHEVAPVFLRMPSVVRMTGLARSTIYRLIAEKEFPSPVRIGPRAVAWRRSELEQWSETRPTAAH
jgi:prophage regulatory protein